MSSLDNDGFRRLEALFHELLELPPDERKVRLRRVAEEDPEIHAELSSMLEDATDALQHEAGIDELAREAEELVARGERQVPDAPFPEQIGRYRLLHRLGAGGMGEVWEAEQTEPVSRRVAVKIVRGRNPSGDANARFRAERQALATMDHPNIARVFDAGETPTGLPYYVMELVDDAVPLTRYCDRHELSLDARLRLFLPICNAVEHAHRKRIIHRDLKPSNVLITEVEGRPVPKVIDFGIAKPLEEALQLGESHATRIGELVGTPEYMSPEQAALGTVDIDTRSDVYTLGLLLYELLVGDLPISSRELRRLPFDELCRRIREDETPKPSTRLRESGSEPSTGTTWRRIQGDLDRILGKALAKDRERRYGSAAELGEDVRRFLDEEPVLATPPSFSYQAKKFFRRHRLAVALGGLALLLLLVALGGVSWGLVRAQRAEQVAATEAQTAQRVSAFLEDLLREGNPEEAQGAASVADLLDLGTERIQTELEDEPAVRSRLLLTLSNANFALGRYPTALDLVEKTVVLRETLFGGTSVEVEQALNKQVEILQRSGDLERAEQVANEQRRIAEAVYSPDDPDRAASMLQLGTVRWRRGDFTGALELLEQGLALRERTLGTDHESLPSLLNNVAILYWQAARYAEAGELYERALEIQRRDLGPDHPKLAGTLNNLALVREAGQDFEASLALHQEALRIRRLAFEDPHPYVAETLNNMANAYEGLGRIDEAVQATSDALDMRRQIYAAPNDYIATSAFNLGKLLVPSDPARARRLLEEAMNSFVQTLGPDHPNVSYPVLELANLDYTEGDHGSAEDLVRRGLALREDALGERHPLVLPVLHTLERLLEERGATEELAIIESRIESFEQSSPGDSG